jgi:cation diffusion facilitator family transporter
MPRKSRSKSVIYAAMAGNCLVAITKFIAASWTGGSAMFAEGVHSLVDTGNQALLLYGLRRAELRPNSERPLGYGRELYFWSFIVALLIFSLGAGVAVLEGILHIVSPRPIEDAYVNYIVLALAFVFEGTTWLVALRGIDRSNGSGGYVEAFRRSKDPPAFMVLFEDSAALVGIVLAFAGTWAATTYQLPILDGVASILIGAVLAATAGILAIETKSLLIGEPAHPEVVESIMNLALADQAILKVNGVITVHLAPDQIMAALSLEFDDNLTTSSLEAKVVDLEERIRAVHPDIVNLFIKPQTPGRFKEVRQQRLAQ